MTRILGIKVTNRAGVAHKVQHILTLYGCSIRTRLGINDPEDEGEYGAGGLILIELSGDKAEWDKLEADLRKTEEIEVSRMDFGN
ncbi:MAG: hypothetical protein JNL22_01560 [Bacteroidales bacterium]|jgi:hypothetical protein|nr:hypothetical protein [Bacteroidales bacterium]